MTILLRSAFIVSTLIGTPALAQDRVAIFTGSGEGAEVTYVAPGDPRARSALNSTQEVKAPLIAMTGDESSGVIVNYFEATSAPANLPSSAFRSVPLSMAPEHAAGLSRRGDEAWGTGE